MDLRTFRQTAFEPTIKATSDAWLQIRARPRLYLLVWFTLALLPYLLQGLAFSGPVSRSLTDLFAAYDNIIADGDVSNNLPVGVPGPLYRLALYSGISWFFIFLITVFTGVVLSEIVRQFRRKEFPRFAESMKNATLRYWGFMKTVLATAWKIIWRPVLVLVTGMILGRVLGQSLLSSLGFLVGFILIFSGLYRYGLAPFIHLALGIRSTDACSVSHQFFTSQRPIIASLFLVVVFFPFLILIMLFSISVNSGIYIGFGGIVLWFLQSIIQFMAMLVLINFALNTFTIQSETNLPEKHSHGVDT